MEKNTIYRPSPKKHLGFSGSLGVIIFFLAIIVFFPTSASAYAVAPIEISTAGVTVAVDISGIYGSTTSEYCLFFTNDNGVSFSRPNCDVNVPMDPYGPADLEAYGAGNGLYYLYFLPNALATCNPGNGTGRALCESLATLRATFTRSGGVWTSDYSSDPTPRIISWNPAVGSTTASTLVYLSARVFNDNATSVTFNLSNFDTGFQYLPISIPLISSGISSVSTTTVLTPGSYVGTLQMNNSSSTPEAVVVSFIVVSSHSLFSTYASTTFAASTTEAFCIDPSNIVVRFGCAMVMPSQQSILNFTLLQNQAATKIPFAYFYQIKSLLASTSQTASTSLGTLSLEFGTTSDSFHQTIEIFSPSTLRAFVPDSLSTKIKVVTTSLIYIELVWYFWHRSRGLIKHAHSSVQ